MLELREKSTTHTISQLCTCMQNITVIQPNRSYQSYTQCTHVVPISTSGMLANILSDCSRGTGKGQGEEEEKEDALLIL